MDVPTRSRMVGLVLIAAGVAVVLAAVLVYHPGQPAYEHHVHQADRDDRVAGMTVYNYTDLSPEARDAFQRALENDGEATVYGEAARPPDWEYGGDYATYVFVRYEGSLYRVQTYLGRSVSRWLGTLGAGVVGLGLVASGVWWYP